MKVYVAGSYQYRAEIAELVKKLEEAVPGFECTSTWLKQGEEEEELKTKGHQHFINLDMTDIDQSDALLLINDYQFSQHSTGKWVELGVAMQLRKLILVWGKAQHSLFLHDEFTVWEPGGLVDDLIRLVRHASIAHFHGKESEG